jgi:protein-disulfide isomerase
MKKAIWAGLLLAGLPLAGAAAQNWDTTVQRSEQGHRVGNPDATTKMIAFVSYSCPHCAHFEMEAEAPLRLALIEPGKLLLEVRHVLRNPLDLAAALTTECGSEEDFWGNHRTIFYAQEDWLQVAVNATPAQQQRWTTGPMGARMRAIASDLDFYELMAPRGYSSAQLDQCLNDEAAMQDLVARMQADDAEFDIAGTPSFAINGELLPNVHSWDALSPFLEGAAQ